MRRFVTIVLLALLGLPGRAGEYETYYRGLPVSLREPELPQIPADAVSLTAFGGVGDGVTDNTEAFAKAVAALAKQGGGHLVVPGFGSRVRLP